MRTSLAEHVTKLIRIGRGENYENGEALARTTCDGGDPARHCIGDCCLFGCVVWID